MQAALEGLAGMCALAGGQFMMRRVQTEAWPILLNLLKHGTPVLTNPPYAAGEAAASALRWLAPCKILLLW